MHLIDTHTHLYLKEFDEDREEMIQRAFDEGVEKIYLPNIDKSTYNNMMDLVQTYPQHCYPMAGLHPGSVKADFEAELEFVLSKLETEDHFVGVGECGLDYYWDTTFKEQQRAAFTQQLKWGKQFKLPVVIHTRESFQDAIELVEQEKDADLRGIFHCFGGSTTEAQRVIAAGFYLGIGGVLTFKNSGLDTTMEQLDLERVVLETDSPYLAPVPYRGKRNETAYIVNVADKLAEIHGMTVEELARITSENAENIFSRSQ